MMDPHLILISGGLQPVRISEEDYKEYMVASDNAIVLLDSEELFAAVVSSYAELELVVFELSLKNMLGEDAFAQGLGEIRVETFSALSQLNAKLLAFFSAARAYEEQILRLLEGLCGENARKKLSDSIFEKEQNFFSFRLCKALRNLAQHVALPISFFTTNSSLEAETKEYEVTRVRVSVQPALERDKLVNWSDSSTSKRTKSVLEELRNYKEEKIDLRYLVVRFLAELAAVQAEFRLATEKIFEDAQACIARAQNAFPREASGKQILLSKTGDQQGVVCAVDSSVLQALIQQRNKHKSMQRVHKSYVSMGHYAVRSESRLFIEGDLCWIPTR